MLFTVSRALRVCKELPDSDYLFQKLSDILRTSVDHLAAYEDFTGLTLVGHDQDVVDFEEWINGPRNNEAMELTMLDLAYRLKMAEPASMFSAQEPDNRIAAPPNLMMMLAEHQRNVVQRQQQAAVANAGNTPYSPTAAGGGSSRAFIDLTGTTAAAAGNGGSLTSPRYNPTSYAPTSPVYTPTQQGSVSQGGPVGGGVSVPVNLPMPIPIPMPVPIMGAPMAVVTTTGPTVPHNTPLHRVDSVEHLFVPDEVV